ncbi:MAG: DMT family transporter [Desulfovibrionaceae bacterium]|jgi:drug/metabolite transporter (DMT)-like permease|nr:DMT family transporter [Desulfovibrionaceae bacterium]
MNAPFLSRTGPDRKGFLLVLAGAVMISFSAVLVKLAGVSGTQATFHRMAFGALFLILYVLGTRRRLTPDRKHLRSTLLTTATLAVFFTLDLECWHTSILYVGPGLATILANFQVFFLALWGVFLLREPGSVRLFASMPLAVLGLWLLLGEDPSNLPPDTATGVTLGLLTAVWYTGYILTLRRSQSVAGKLPAATNIAWLCVGVMVLTMAESAATGKSFVIRDPEALGLMALYGLGPQALGWVLISKGLPRLPASMAGLVMLIQPTLAFVWDILIFQRPTGPLGALGAAITLAAIYLGLTARR